MNTFIFSCQTPKHILYCSQSFELQILKTGGTLMSCDHVCIFLIFLKDWFNRKPTVNCHLFSFQVKQYLEGHFGVGSDVHSSLTCWNTTPDHPGKSAPSHLPCHTWSHPSGMLRPVTLKPSSSSSLSLPPPILSINNSYWLYFKVYPETNQLSPTPLWLPCWSKPSLLLA